MAIIYWLIIVFSLWITPTLAQESVALVVNQTHTLHWDWSQMPGESSVERFVFRCGTYTKDIVNPTTRSLMFGNLVDQAGTYNGCTLTASNHVGDSLPVVVPAFHYEYSYGAFGRFLLELSAMAGASTILVRQVVGHVRRRTSTKPILAALPEPVIIFTKDRDHVHRHS